MENKKRLTRKQAIKQKCFNCSGYSRLQVRKCEFKDCPLYKYRTGTEKE